MKNRLLTTAATLLGLSTAAVFAVEPTAVYLGTARSVSSHQITVTTLDGNTLKLPISENTKITKYGHPASVAALEKDQTVEVRAVEENHQMRPTEIDVLQYTGR